MGVAGISFEDFCRLRMDEVEAILKAGGEARAEEAHRAWEVMRLQTVMTLSPFCKNLPAPARLLPFPWDNKPDEDAEEPLAPLTEEERTANERRLRASLGW